MGNNTGHGGPVSGRIRVASAHQSGNRSTSPIHPANRPWLLVHPVPNRITYRTDIRECDLATIGTQPLPVFRHPRRSPLRPSLSGRKGSSVYRMPDLQPDRKNVTRIPTRTTYPGRRLRNASFPGLGRKTIPNPDPLRKGFCVGLFYVTSGENTGIRCRRTRSLLWIELYLRGKQGMALGAPDLHGKPRSSPYAASPGTPSATPHKTRTGGKPLLDHSFGCRRQVGTSETTCCSMDRGSAS